VPVVAVSSGAVAVVIVIWGNTFRKVGELRCSLAVQL